MAVNKNVDVTAKLLDKYKIEMKARDHTAYIDQPPAMGGEDFAPTPLEYVFFALAGCICTIGKIVAAQERIDLRGIECKVEGGLNTAVLMGKSNAAVQYWSYGASGAHRSRPPGPARPSAGWQRLQRDRHTRLHPFW